MSPLLEARLHQLAPICLVACALIPAHPRRVACRSFFNLVPVLYDRLYIVVSLSAVTSEVSIPEACPYLAGIHQLQVGKHYHQLHGTCILLTSSVVSKSICCPTGILLDCMANYFRDIYVAADVILPCNLSACSASCIQQPQLVRAFRALTYIRDAVNRRMCGLYCTRLRVPSDALVQCLGATRAEFWGLLAGCILRTMCCRRHVTLMTARQPKKLAARLRWHLSNPTFGSGTSEYLVHRLPPGTREYVKIDKRYVTARRPMLRLGCIQNVASVAC